MSGDGSRPGATGHLRIPMWLIVIIVTVLLGQTGAIIGGVVKFGLGLHDMRATIKDNRDRIDNTTQLSKANLSAAQFTDLMVARDNNVNNLENTQRQISARIRNIELRMSQHWGAGSDSSQ